jgi:hypothetical protein
MTNTTPEISNPGTILRLHRFYVTMTWDDFPEGGSYGTVVEAKDHEQAERFCRLEMAASRCEQQSGDLDDNDDEQSIEEFLDEYDAEWHLIDCFDLDEFIQNHIIDKSANLSPGISKSPRCKIVCTACGSVDVLVDAYACWNVETQTFEIHDTFDKGHFCRTCDGECRVEERQLENT